MACWSALRPHRTTSNSFTIRPPADFRRFLLTLLNRSLFVWKLEPRGAIAHLIVDRSESSCQLKGHIVEHHQTAHPCVFLVPSVWSPKVILIPTASTWRWFAASSGSVWGLLTTKWTWVCSGTLVPSTRTPAIPIRMTCSRRVWRRATFGTQVPCRTCGRRLNSCDPTAWLVTFTTQRCSPPLLQPCPCTHQLPVTPQGKHQQKSPTWDTSVLAHPCDRRKSVSPGLMRGRVHCDRPVLLGSLVAKPHCTMDQHSGMSPAPDRNHLPLAPLRQRLPCTSAAQTLEGRTLFVFTQASPVRAA